MFNNRMSLNHHQSLLVTNTHHQPYQSPINQPLNLTNNVNHHLTITYISISMSTINHPSLVSRNQCVCWPRRCWQNIHSLGSKNFWSRSFSASDVRRTQRNSGCGGSWADPAGRIRRGGSGGVLVGWWIFKMGRVGWCLEWVADIYGIWFEIYWLGYCLDMEMN